MPRHDPVETALENLAALRHRADSPATIDELRSALISKSNFVVARAAKIAGELHLHALAPDLVRAFQRLMANPAKLDKGCAALTEIVAALYEIDYTEADVYLPSIHHVQMEGSFGPPVDVAAKLRGLAAQGLARSSHSERLSEVVSLLVDKEPPARIGAVRALASNGGDTGALLLRLKVLTGDEEPEVLSECFLGLIAHTASAIPFVAHYSDSDDLGVAEAAILALGSSRHPDALPALQAKWERTVHGPLRKTLLTAISLLRTDEAADFLLQLLDSEHVTTAKEIVVALAAYRSNDRIRQQATDIVRRRDELSLTTAFHREF